MTEHDTPKHRRPYSELRERNIEVREPRHCLGRPTMVQRLGAAAVTIEDFYNIVRVDDLPAGVGR